jgi:hypothetical protein
MVNGYKYVVRKLIEALITIRRGGGGEYIAMSVIRYCFHYLVRK